MNNKLKILLAAILVVAVITREQICEHLGFGPFMPHDDLTTVTDNASTPETTTNDIAGPLLDQATVEAGESNNYYVNDSIYHWDKKLLDWMPLPDAEEFQTQFSSFDISKYPKEQPIELTWQILTDIQYRLRYFSQLEMEIFAPLFPEAMQALHGREVIIKGYVIPFDTEQEVLALSANPFASCFFCGKASPASVLSMYLENKAKRYNMDAHKEFTGTLYLNYDNPNEFYYILRNAEEN